MHENFYREVLDSLSEGVYCVDCSRKVTYWNKAAEIISGYAAQDVVGKSCADNILQHIDSAGRSLCLSGCPLSHSMDHGNLAETSVYLHHKNGHRVPVYVKTMPLRHEGGSVYGAVETFTIVTSSMSLLEELEKFRKEVLRDPVTGIGNRRYAESTLQRFRDMFGREGLPYGIIFVDIDHFSAVKDAWGQEVGDKVLRMVANTLAGGLRALDVVCRWSGEEFLVALPSVTVHELRRIAERLRILIRNSWLDHAEERIQVTATFGGAVAAHGESFELVLQRATSALRDSRDVGRDSICIPE